MATNNNLLSFARNITIRAIAIGASVNEVKKNCAKVAADACIEGTPVDTGKARSNWIASVGADDASVVIEPHAPGSRLGISERANAAAASAAAHAAIDQCRPGEDIFVHNNVHYIGQLNDGSSTQAPAAFAQTAVMQAVQKVKNAKVVP